MILTILLSRLYLGSLNYEKWSHNFQKLALSYEDFLSILFDY